MSQITAATDNLKAALDAEEGGRRWLRRLAVAGAFTAVIGGGLIWSAKHRPPPPLKYTSAATTVGDVVEKVQATGTVQPMLQVNIGAQVSGRVTRVLVDFNSVVKKGDVLAEIDPAMLGSQVSANQAQLMGQRAQLDQARAQMDSVKAQAETAKATYQRVLRLFEGNLAAKGDLDNAKGALDQLTAQYQAATAAAQSAQAGIAAQQAQLNQSMTNVGYTKIYSPVDGVVVTRGIDPGATVVASFQAPVLFTIAQDLREMRVLADVDEADVGHLKEQMGADAVVDAFPGETFHGVVQQIRYSPNNVQGVVTYSAIVKVANPEEKLRPGMTSTITIRTKEAKGALRVPNAALRFHPSPPLGSDGKPVVQPPEAPLAKGEARIYLLTNDKPGDEKIEPKLVHVGITDGMFTELIDGSIKADTKVVTDEADREDDKKKKG